MSGWQNQYSLIASLIDAINTQDFFVSLSRLYEAGTHYDSLVISSFEINKPPKELFSDLQLSETKKTLQPYFEHSYILDPFYQMFTNNIEDGAYRLLEHTPDNFKNSEYYKTYYTRTGLLDECGVFITVGSNTRFLLSLGLRDRTVKITPQSILHIKHIMPCVSAVFRRHYYALNFDSHSPQTASPQYIHEAFSNFGRNCLSQREKQVVQFILQGHSSKSIARLLELSPDTVKVHRKRLYKKLGVSSQGELFCTFLSKLESHS